MGVGMGRYSVYHLIRWDAYVLTFINEGDEDHGSEVIFLRSHTHQMLLHLKTVKSFRLKSRNIWKIAREALPKGRGIVWK